MKPLLILYNAVSVDGRFDWIKPDLGVFYSVISKWKENATIVGSNTLLTAPNDIPKETKADLTPIETDPNDKRPIFVVADSGGRVRNWHFWRKQPYWRDCLILHSKSTPADYLKYLDDRCIEHWCVGKERVDFKRALNDLNKRKDVKVVRADCGGTLNGVLLRAGLVDEIHLLVHPALVGGRSPKTFFAADDLKSDKGVVNLRLKRIKRQPNDLVMMSYEVVRAGR